MKISKYLVASTMLLASLSAVAQQLPAPQVAGGKPLMETIAQRHSSRDISAQSTVTKQELSNMLWAAWGITHDGKRTVATAMNKQELKLYVITATEVSLYDAATNSLKVVNTGDFRQYAAAQDYAKTAPLNIAFVADATLQPNEVCQGYTMGAASQNIYLYCTQEGLKTVVRGSFDRTKLAQALKLAPTDKLWLVQTVGR